MEICTFNANVRQNSKVLKSGETTKVKQTAQVYRIAVLPEALGIGDVVRSNFNIHCNLESANEYDDFNFYLRRKPSGSPTFHVRDYLSAQCSFANC